MKCPTCVPGANWDPLQEHQILLTVEPSLHLWANPSFKIPQQKLEHRDPPWELSLWACLVIIFPSDSPCSAPRPCLSLALSCSITVFHIYPLPLSVGFLCWPLMLEVLLTLDHWAFLHQYQVPVSAGKTPPQSRRVKETTLVSRGPQPFTLSSLREACGSFFTDCFTTGLRAEEPVWSHTETSKARS